MAAKYRTVTEKDRQEIIHKLKEFVDARKEIIFTYIYGSFAEGLPFADIDVSIYIDENVVPENDALDYGLRISGEAEIETHITPLDVKVINYAPVGFKFYATKGMLLFSRNEDIRCEFLEKVWKIYFDLLPKRRQVILDLVSV